MNLPYPTDPSLPTNPSPVFSDVSAARGDHLRANNAEIWADLAYLLARFSTDGTFAADSDDLAPTQKAALTKMNALDAALKIATLAVNQPFPIGLTAKRNAGAPDTKIDVVIDTLYVQGILATPGTYTLDQAASPGALGIDAGAWAASTWYIVWALCKADGTTTIIASTSTTSPALPAGYITKRIVTFVYTAVTTKFFIDFVQSGKIWNYVTAQTMFAESNLSSGNRDCSQWVPAIVSELFLNSYVVGSKAASGYEAYAIMRGYNNGAYVHECLTSVQTTVLNATAGTRNSHKMITTNRQIYTDTTGSTGAPSTFFFYLYITGFVIPFGEGI